MLWRCIISARATDLAYLKPLLDFLTRPSNFFLVLAAFALVALLWRARATAIACLSLSVAGFTLFGFTSLSEVAIAPLVTRFPPVDLETADPPFGIVVLGAGLSEGHALHNGTLMELTDGGEAIPTAALLARRYPQARLILSGGSGTDFPPAPQRGVDGMRRLLLAYGIAEERITIDPNSSTTADRVRNTLALIGEDREQTWWAVTPAHRMPRLIGAYRKQGFEPVPFPIDFKWIPPFSPTYLYPFSEGLQLTDQGIHEWRGLAFYYLRGEIDTLFPGP